MAVNFIFISPQFPHTYWEFCNRLKQNGVTVLGIADTPYDTLSPELRDSLTEYYRVENMEDYSQMYRAVAFLAFKYGKIDWIESNNEYWLEQDARLRTDFNITTGIGIDRISSIKEKSEMKKYYHSGGIATARQVKGSDGYAAVSDFAHRVGYPLIAKPDVGVGAGGTFKIDDYDSLLQFFNRVDAKSYVIEEYITGDICSYDAIINSAGVPLFESMTVWPPSIMDIVNKQLDLSYYVAKDIPEKLRSVGRKTVKAFAVNSRFVHLEFFRLDSDRGDLGKRGDFVALEVNMRPAGGYTPDMINYAHSTDVYKIWADMVAYDSSKLASFSIHDAHNALSRQWNEQYYCVFASRRDCHTYRHSHEEVLKQYGGCMVMCERMPDILSGAMGNQMYTVRLKTTEEKDRFIAYVHEKA
ncbi:MAG: acetyl-CoA carboxylase biotin carboxylase subunit family protein [Candidatus Limisoma sp.]